MADPALEQALAKADRLAKEVEFYKRELNELGGRLIRSQEEQRRNFLAAARERSIARCCGDIDRWVNMAPSSEHYRAEVLAAIAGIFMADRVVMLHHKPGSHRLQVTQALGIPAEYPATLSFTGDVPERTYSRSGVPYEDAASRIAIFLGVPYILWVYDPATFVAVAVGCVRETNISRVFEPADLDIMHGLLEGYLGGLARLGGKSPTQGLRDASTGPGVTETEIARCVKGMPRSRIVRAIVVQRVDDGARSYVVYLDLSWSTGYRIMRTQYGVADKTWRDLRRCVQMLRDEYDFQAAIALMALDSPEIPLAIRDRELLLQTIDQPHESLDANPLCG